LLNFLWITQIYAHFVVIGSVATAFVRLLELPMTAKLDAIPFPPKELATRGLTCRFRRRLLTAGANAYGPARAIKRRDDDQTNWCVADADAVHVIADLLVRLHGQETSPLDLAFAERDDELA
jgi:hypothetical protein